MCVCVGVVVVYKENLIFWGLPLMIDGFGTGRRGGNKGISCSLSHSLSLSLCVCVCVCVCVCFLGPGLTFLLACFSVGLSLVAKAAFRYGILPGPRASAPLILNYRGCTTLLHKCVYWINVKD